MILCTSIYKICNYIGKFEVFWRGGGWSAKILESGNFMASDQEIKFLLPLDLEEEKASTGQLI